MKPNPVKTHGLSGKRYPIGICYVIIPGDVDRETYIQDCFRRGVVTVQFENGSYMVNIPISVGVLQNIDFPLDVEQLGSCLIYANEHVHNKPIIIGRLIKDDESTSLNENEFRLAKSTEGGSVSISGIAKEGNLFVNVTGRTDKGGKIYINVVNPENEGEIVVNLQGNLQMELQTMVLNILKELGIRTKSNININSTEGVINLGDIEAENGVEPILLGTKTVDELSKEIQALTDLLSSISNIIPQIVPANAIDPTWAAWQTVVANIVSRGDLSEVKSEKTFSE